MLRIIKFKILTKALISINKNNIIDNIDNDSEVGEI